MTETSEIPTQLNPQQVQSLYEEFAEGLRRFLLGVLKDPLAADDACQLTFVRLVEKGHLVQQSGAMKSWLFQVAFNEAMLIKRRQSTGQRHQESVGRHLQTRNQGQTFEASADQLIRQENIHRVQLALEELSEVQREVVVKRIYDGKKFREIADELNLPLATVLSRMQASLKKLKPVLKSILPAHEG